MNIRVKSRVLASLSDFSARHEKRKRLHAERLERLRRIRKGEVKVGRKGRKVINETKV